MSIIGVIPCRYKSIRLPGKPLALINGKPMMWHVYQRAIESNVLDEIIIATDDYRIMDEAKRLNLTVLMTDENHESGTDRVAEVAKKMEADFFINIQGDEPLIDPNAIKIVAKSIKECQDPNVLASNAYSNINNADDINDANVVKVIINNSSLAMAYSRLGIPYPQSGSSKHLKQLGLYGFTKKGLEIFSSHKSGPLEHSERVEMFRFIEHGYDVLMVPTNDDYVSVDTEADLHKVRKIFGESFEI